MCRNYRDTDDPRYGCDCHLEITDEQLEAEQDAREDYEFEQYRAEKDE